jgi:hypothetical protein
MATVDTVITKPATAPTSHVDCFPARPKTGPTAKARKHQRAASKLGQDIAAELSAVGAELDAATGQLADLITKGDSPADLLALIGSLDRRRTELEAHRTVSNRVTVRLSQTASLAERTDPKFRAWRQTCKSVQAEWQRLDAQALERYPATGTFPRTKEAKAHAAALAADRQAWRTDARIRLASDAASGRYDS